jgi:hypothetical protein
MTGGEIGAELARVTTWFPETRPDHLTTNIINLVIPGARLRASPESRYCKRMGPSSSRHRELKMDSGLRHEAHPGMTGGEIGDL